MFIRFYTRARGSSPLRNRCFRPCRAGAVPPGGRSTEPATVYLRPYTHRRAPHHFKFVDLLQWLYTPVGAEGRIFSGRTGAYSWETTAGSSEKRRPGMPQNPLFLLTCFILCIVTIPYCSCQLFFFPDLWCRIRPCIAYRWSGG